MYEIVKEEGLYRIIDTETRDYVGGIESPDLRVVEDVKKHINEDRCLGREMLLKKFHVKGWMSCTNGYRTSIKSM